PDFTLKTLEGDSLQLSALNGRTVLLNFWATWCTPCLQEMPLLAQLHRKWEARGVTVLGISLDQGDTEIITHYTQRLAIPYPILLGSEAVAIAYRVIALPATYVIDADGMITNHITGLVNIEELEATLNGQLKSSVQ
ncbi:MAG: TlpA family protein disulfide reductase, partial [Rhodothermaceae bacterium]|nr:TlpA family protein disulfide reductase [Rhodothermaceae bacterium]MYF64268.1 TlpA family protein disulfide reductase [Rhodothermaceae bacterium]